MRWRLCCPQLAGFDLGSKIQGLKGLTGTSGGTEIQVLHADVRETPAETELTNISCVVPAIGTATGAGTVAESGALNFQLTVKLSGSGAAGAAAGGGADMEVVAPRCTMLFTCCTRQPMPACR